MVDQAELMHQIRLIQSDSSLSDAEKAHKRQALLSGGWTQRPQASDSESEGEDAPAEQPQQTTIFDESLKCTMCMELCNRPITAPCQHNFCLGCFNKWVAQGKKSCPTCRSSLPAKFIANPRINTALAGAIRMAKLGDRPTSNKAIERVRDKDRPDEAFTTDRAVRAGRANAASGRIMVTVPNDHFGPIPAEHDPRGLGVKVGEFWNDRLDCRQWGAHFPHVAGIAGQSNQGAQSVVLSGGYEDDRDEGEWFLYTGSGGRDLSGNKRVTNVQSFDQTFEKMNKALLLSCQKGLPVRVVRSHKEKRSAYAPSEEQPVRYDGIYRIAAAYRKAGNQGKLVCRYLFRRSDNEPAPWASDDAGDRPWEEPLPADALTDMQLAKGAIHRMTDQAWWGWQEEQGTWGWLKAAPVSQRGQGDENGPKKARARASQHERALKAFHCGLCQHVLQQPLSTPCGHHFCKPCLDKPFQAAELLAQATSGRRTLRERRPQMPCPSCKLDIAEFMSTAQINLGMVDVIAKLQAAAKEAAAAAADAEGGAAEPEDVEAAEELAQEAALAEAQDADQEAASGAGASAAGPSEAAAAVPAPAPRRTAAEAAAAEKASKLVALAEEFPEFDEALLGDMLDDQAGDLLEVRLYLARMRKAAAAAKRKAASPKGKAGKPAAKPQPVSAAPLASAAGDEPSAPPDQGDQSLDDQPAADKAGPGKSRGRKGKQPLAEANPAPDGNTAEAAASSSALVKAAAKPGRKPAAKRKVAA